MTSVNTWHHGLVARWWTEFNVDGDDISFFLDQVRRFGEPVLDAGCGTGRLLLPMLAAGLDAEGTDPAADMLRGCRERAGSEGFTPILYDASLWDFTSPRRYQCIVVCGAFGLGGTRQQDQAGLTNLYSHLAPGGALIMDHYLPNFHARDWQRWVEQPDLPAPWPQRGDRRSCADGTELELRTRQTALDPLEQRTRLEIRVDLYRAERRLAVEQHEIEINLYLMPEIRLMLEHAGFSQIGVVTLDGEAPQPWRDQRIVFVART